MTKITSDVIKFSGQAHLDTFSLDLERVAVDLDRYDDVSVDSLRLSLEAIRKRTESFAYWQRRCRTGRPAYEERTLLVAFLVQQLLGLTFRETEGVLAMVRSCYRLERVPDHSTLSRKLSLRRWTTVLERFFQHLVNELSKRSSIVVRTPPATPVAREDGGRRSTPRVLRRISKGPHGDRGRRVLGSFFQADEVERARQPQVFADAWDRLPPNVLPKRSLADSAYSGNDCLAAARQHGATPLHAIKKNARNCSRPETFYQKLVNFAHHWPRHFASLYAKRVHAETVFSIIGALLGYRLRCRSKNGRNNEVRVKFALFDLVQLAMRKEFWS